MDGVLYWDCVCDACDREGRYHTIGEGRFSPPQPPDPPQKPDPPRWLLILCWAIAFAVVYVGIRFVTGL